ncbi:hypothetical protein PIB30_034108 [Stylosanthes scabra]|uniref:Condensation domain-containing protein n=1 Tax=Stylosanthes scabra TaxID=79078 RepID=A0ABU6SCN7_9FABA|nr:hypothetical protein [Stylosanthes scabra]
MSSSSSEEEKQEELLQHFTTRAVGGTEYSWCKAVPGGTGITVLGLLLSKPPHIPKLQTVLRNLQNSNPILRSTIHFDSTANSFHFRTPPTSNVEIHSFDLQFTSGIPGCGSGDADADFHLILERELNRNTWRDPSDDGYGVLCVSVYAISESRWGVFLRLHTSGCDRAAAVTLLRELLEKVGCGGESNGETEEKGMGMAIEDLIPVAKRNKPFWARGLDMLGYSLNSFRLGNLDFVDADSPRSSKVVRLQLDAHHTRLIVAKLRLCTAVRSRSQARIKEEGCLACDNHRKTELHPLTWPRRNDVFGTMLGCVRPATANVKQCRILMHGLDAMTSCIHVAYPT